MGWENIQSYMFEYEDEIFNFNGSKRLMKTLEDLEMDVGSYIYYTYYMENLWVHDIKLENISRKMNNQPVPYCLDGRRACPPENIGGPFLFKRFLNAVMTQHLEGNEDKKD